MVAAHVDVGVLRTEQAGGTSGRGSCEDRGQLVYSDQAVTVVVPLI